MDEFMGSVPGRGELVEKASFPTGGGESAPAATPVVKVKSAPRTILGTILWVVVVLICYAGMVVTGALSQGHRQVAQSEKGLLAAACSPKLGEGVSCDQVLQSRWAYQWVPVSPPVAAQWVTDRIAALRGMKVPARGNEGWAKLPVAWLGLAYFAAMGTWFLFIGQPSRSRRWLHLIPLLVIGAALIGSGCFMYLLLFRLPAICPLCVMTHAVNLLLFVGAVLLWPRRPREVPGVAYIPRPSWKQVVTTLVLMWFVVQVVLMNQAVGQSGSEVAAYQARLGEYENNPLVQFELAADKLSREKKYEIPIDPDDPVYGNRNARRTLVLFSDFQCPACRVLHDRIMAMWPELERIAAPVGGIRFVYKHYPLYTPCNARANTNMHAYSCEAAKAAEAARIVGGPPAFWKMGELLYRNQQDLDLAPYAKYAEALGLDVAAFEKARRSTEAAERVARHVKEGADAGMSATPGLYLDGVRITEFGRSGPSIWALLLRLPEWPPTESVMNLLPAVRRSATRPAPPATRAAVPSSARTR
jgi:protein-disulfide isomerase/uncharacterized membrane protein